MVLAVSLIILGAFGLIIPFIGPLFGFGMGPDPAWVMTEARFVRHVIPGAAVILGGVMLLPRMRASRGLGATLALLGGTWFVLAPVVLGRVVEDMPPLIDIVRPITYHYGVGLVIAVIAGYALGRWVTPAPGVVAPAERADDRRPERERREVDLREEERVRSGRDAR